MAHKPSKAFEQQSVKEKISQLKAMKPYLDEDQKVFNEDYIMLRVKITQEVAKWKQNNQEEEKISQNPDIKFIEDAIAPSGEPEAKLASFKLDAPAKALEYETSN